MTRIRAALVTGLLDKKPPAEPPEPLMTELPRMIEPEPLPEPEPERGWDLVKAFFAKLRENVHRLF